MHSESDLPTVEESDAAGSPVLRVVVGAEAANLATSISLGSPFAPGTALPLELVGQQITYEAGVWRETMLGGLLASILMLPFGIGSLLIFPIGAVMIAAVGCMLGSLALSTRRPRLAFAATLGNLIVLAMAFTRTLS